MNFEGVEMNLYTISYCFEELLTNTNILIKFDAIPLELFQLRKIRSDRSKR